METHHRLEAMRSENRRREVHRVLGRSASCVLLAGLLVGCAATTPVESEPLPQPVPPTPQPKPDAPTEDGKGWKPVTS